MEQRKKFYVALSIYAVLGLLIWMTIDNIPLPVGALVPVSRQSLLAEMHVTLRQLALGVIGVIALLTVIHWRADALRAEKEHKREFSS
jgi:hypothetical protein